MIQKTNYKFSGHETFPCRYAWLPKVIMAIQKSSHILSDENEAMVELGVGKNMVRAIRFWATATGIAENFGPKGWRITRFGDAILGDGGFDPYLEDLQTLWLLHWNLSRQFEEPLFAWNYLLNRWHEPEISRSSALVAFDKEAKQLGRNLSRTTLKHHFDTFIHTYVPTRGTKPSAMEDSLDCPLVELNLIETIGERMVENGGTKREPVYAFRREEKPEISLPLFAYCVADFALHMHPEDITVSFRELAIGNGSPGQVFKLPERAVWARLEQVSTVSKNMLSFAESADIQQLVRDPNMQPLDLLPRIYHRELVYA